MMIGPEVFTLSVIDKEGEVFSIKFENTEKENPTVFDFMESINEFVEENRFFMVLCNCEEPSMIAIDESEVDHLVFSEDGNPASAIIVDWDSTTAMRAKGMARQIEQSGFVAKPHEMFHNPEEE